MGGRRLILVLLVVVYQSSTTHAWFGWGSSASSENVRKQEGLVSRANQIRRSVFKRLGLTDGFPKRTERGPDCSFQHEVCVSRKYPDSSQGMNISEVLFTKAFLSPARKYGLTHCLDQRRECYDKCETKFGECEKQLQRCILDRCMLLKTEKAGNRCRDFQQQVTSITGSSGCNEFLLAKMRSCSCSPTDTLLESSSVLPEVKASGHSPRLEDHEVSEEGS
eukprot:gb/GECG01007288.1/.p1 GENE.gb/GECG01007288.1/~~gb/GECG01007288.1/.p1  ORF type:complete len:221 (+),score=21.87 gb/GECG01007288.1/:1-663(+)